MCPDPDLSGLLNERWSWESHMQEDVCQRAVTSKQHVWYLQGIWKPKKISNPDYFEDETPLNNLGDIGAVAVEIWTMDQGYFFDNVLVTNKAEKALEYRTNYWQPKHEHEVVCSSSRISSSANV